MLSGVIFTFGRSGEIIVEVCGSGGVYFSEFVGIDVFGGCSSCFGWFGGRYFDTCALGESFDGLGECEVLAHLEEGEDAATGAAGEAFEDLLCWVDVHAWSVVVVEGAEAEPFLAFFDKADVLADYVDDVAGL